MAQYYGLISGLHQLKQLQSNTVNIAHIKTVLNQYLEPNELNFINLFWIKYDLFNLNQFIHNLPSRLEGGNLNDENFEKIVRTGITELPLFANLNFNQDSFKKNQVKSLFKMWQVYYNTLLQYQNNAINQLIQLEITLKNLLQKGHATQLNIQHNNDFLSGGYFEPHMYLKLNTTDLMAEFPTLAQIIQSIQTTDLLAREQKIIQLKWQFYDEICFFNSFGLEAVYAWLLKFFDNQVHQLNNQTLGKNQLMAFNQNVLQTTQKFL